MKSVSVRPANARSFRNLSHIAYYSLRDVEALAWISFAVIRVRNLALNGDIYGHRFWEPGPAPTGNANVSWGAR